MRTSHASVPALLVLAMSSASSADRLTEPSTGQSFEREQQAGGASFSCVGVGVRKFLFVKIYAAAFCLESASAAATVKGYAAKAHPGLRGEELAEALEEDASFFEALQDAPGEKLVVMKLVRDVPKEKMAGAFQDALSSVLSPAKIALLVGALEEDAKEGQRILLYSARGSLRIEVDGKHRRVDDAEVARKLWRVWLGEKSVTPSMRGSIAAQAAR